MRQISSMVLMLEILNGLMSGRGLGRGLRRAFAPSVLRTLLFCFLLSGFWLPSSAYAQYYIYTAPKDQPPFLNTGNFPCNTTRTEGSIRFVTSSLTFEGCNGTTWSALAGGSMAIGNTVTSGTQGSVLFISGGGLVQDNSSFFWDEANKRLGIGNAAPGALLDIGKNATTLGTLRLENTSAGHYVQFQPSASATASTTYTMPTTAGSSGQVLSTNGSGVLSWVAAGGGGSIDALSDALYDTTTDHNMDLGSNGPLTSGAQYNLFIGEGAGHTTTSAATGNTAIGYYALNAQTTGNQNTAIGDQALKFSSSGADETAIGFQAMMGSSGNGLSGIQNTAVGEKALNAIQTTAKWNTALGADTLETSTTGNSNTAVGMAALQYAASSDNTALGTYALTSVSGTPLTGQYNTAVGTSALTIAQGTAQLNTALGSSALEYNSTGESNTAVGSSAMVGVSGTPLTGSYNTALGASALALAQGIAQYNTALGASAGAAITTGTDNTLVGDLAGHLITGNSNIVLGENGNITTGGSNILIGNSLTGTTATSSNQIDIGDVILGTGTNVPSSSTITIAGNLTVTGTCTNCGSGGGGTPAGSNTQIQFNSGGSFGANSNFVWNNSTNALTVTGDINYSGIITDTSDIRLKKDIRPLSESGDMLDKLTKVDTYSYIRKNNPHNRVEYGVIAQQLKTVFPDLVHTAKDSQHTESVDYTGLIPPLIESAKELKAQNDNLRASNYQLRADNNAMRNKLEKLSGDIDGLKAITGYGTRRASFDQGAIAGMLALLGLMLAGRALRSRRMKTRG